MLHPLTSLSKFKKLVDYALDNNQRIGFDSCGCNAFLKAISGRKNYKQLEQMSEPCESGLFSYYIDVNGIGYPCSFCAGETRFKGINILKARNFLHDVWNHKETQAFREDNLHNCRNCIAFNLEVK